VRLAVRGASLAPCIGPVSAFVIALRRFGVATLMLLLRRTRMIVPVMLALGRS
jgi:hypothetical protein